MCYTDCCLCFFFPFAAFFPFFFPVLCYLVFFAAAADFLCMLHGKQDTVGSIQCDLEVSAISKTW